VRERHYPQNFGRQKIEVWPQICEKGHCHQSSGRQRKHGSTFDFNILCEEEHGHQKTKKAWQNTVFVFNIAISLFVMKDIATKF
jgi:hypothetical protein